MTYREAAETLKHIPGVILTDHLKTALRMAVILLEREAEKIEAAEDAEVTDI
jgi:hypothetical protein